MANKFIVSLFMAQTVQLSDVSDAWGGRHCEPITVYTERYRNISSRGRRADQRPAGSRGGYIRSAMLGHSCRWVFAGNCMTTSATRGSLEPFGRICSLRQTAMVAP